MKGYCAEGRSSRPSLAMDGRATKAASAEFDVPAPTRKNSTHCVLPVLFTTCRQRCVGSLAGAVSLLLVPEIVIGVDAGAAAFQYVPRTVSVLTRDAEIVDRVPSTR